MRTMIVARNLIFLILLANVTNLMAQNPFINGQFTADPTARLFNDTVYVYPSHDILASERKGRIGWFCMEDYHVFSSVDLTRWTDHGVIVSQENVPWANPKGYSMWAPDCIEHNGKYFFYFPAGIKDTSIGKGFGIGVAIADKPYGPFIPQADAIKDVQGIDPNVFIDHNSSEPKNRGKAYLYWAKGKIYVARLDSSMLNLASEPQVVSELPGKGLIEGPFVFERNGIYYLTYPHVQNNIERLEYAISNNPMGPFKFAGVIMDESPTGCWTNHQSILEYKGQWYLFYHHNDYSPQFDKSRSIRIDSMFFNADGTIKKVTPTLRGVGISKATDTLQIDRYSLINDTSVHIGFIEPKNHFEGWKITLSNKNTWIKYNSVDFGNHSLNSVIIKVKALKTTSLSLNTLGQHNKPMAELKIPEGDDWQIIKAPIGYSPQGIQHLILTLTGNQPIEVDWLKFTSEN